MAFFVGFIDRILWDFSTCGHSFCDGPYQGFLAEVTRTEQLWWHLAPCCCICLLTIHTTTKALQNRSDLV